MEAWPCATVPQSWPQLSLVPIQGPLQRENSERADDSWRTDRAGYLCNLQLAWAVWNAASSLQPVCACTPARIYRPYDRPYDEELPVGYNETNMPSPKHLPGSAMCAGHWLDRPCPCRKPPFLIYAALSPIAVMMDATVYILFIRDRRTGLEVTQHGQLLARYHLLAFHHLRHLRRSNDLLRCHCTPFGDSRMQLRRNDMARVEHSESCSS